MNHCAIESDTRVGFADPIGHRQRLSNQQQQVLSRIFHYGTLLALVGICYIGKMASPESLGPDHPGVSRLSNREREVLRLVAKGYETDEIARLLQRASGTIENQIKNARAKLGGVRRLAAARLLIDAERSSQSPAIPPLAIAPSASNAAIDGRPIETETAPLLELNDVRSDFRWDRVEPRERRVNDLSLLPRLLIIVAIAAVSILTLMVVPLAYDGLQRWSDHMSVNKQ